MFQENLIIPLSLKKLTILNLYLNQIKERMSGEFRWKYLTTSSIWKAFGTKVLKINLYSKCKPLDISKYTGRVNLDSPLHWGQKYEGFQ